MRKVIIKDNGLIGSEESPLCYKFFGLQGEIVSLKTGATVSPMEKISLPVLNRINYSNSNLAVLNYKISGLTGSFTDTTTNTIFG